MKKILFLAVLLLNTLHTFSQSGWFQLQTGTTSELNDIYFFNPDTGYICGQNNVFLKTTNGGLNWTSLDPPGNKHYSDFNFISTAVVFASAFNQAASDWEILKSTNSGINWINILPPNNEYFSANIHFLNENTGFHTGDNIYKTTNSGINWLSVMENSINSSFGEIFFTSENTGYARRFGGSIWVHHILKTTNSGLNWFINHNVGSTNGFAYTHFVNDTTGFVISRPSPNVTYISKTSNGINWTTNTLDPNNTYYAVFFFDINTGYITADNGKIFKTTDGGLTLYNQTQGSGGFPATKILFVNNEIGYAGGILGFLRKTTNGGNPIGITQISTEIPKSFSLHQNYPNPFNPSTKIKFSVAKLSNIKIVIFDILGREINTLVNQQLKPGIYETDFSANSLASGVYFYKLITDDFSESKKMVLVK